MWTLASVIYYIFYLIFTRKNKRQNKDKQTLNSEFRLFPYYILDDNWDCSALDNSLESGARGCNLTQVLMETWSPTFLALELWNRFLMSDYFWINGKKQQRKDVNRKFTCSW